MAEEFKRLDRKLVYHGTIIDYYRDTIQAVSYTHLVDKSFAIQAGREVRVMVVPEQISDADMVLLARDISKQIEAELEYPGQIKVNMICLLYTSCVVLCVVSEAAR